jgi:hypothetical protein
MEMFNAIDSSFATDCEKMRKRKRTFEKCKFFHCSGDLVIPENGFVRNRMA